MGLRWATRCGRPTIDPRPDFDCPAFAWCVNDHSDPQVPDGEHARQIIIEVGDVCEVFRLEVLDDVPRIFGGVDIGEIWVEPDEETNTLRDAATVLARAADAYDAFAREVTPTLRRSHAVTEHLVEVEG